MTPLKRQLNGTTILTREPITIGSAILGPTLTAATTVGTYALGAAIVGYVVTTAVTSFIMAALTPEPGLPDSRGLLVNARSSVAAQEFVYGQIRKGGVITYIETTGGNNKHLHQTIAFAGHEVEEIGDVYLNDQIVTITDDGGFAENGTDLTISGPGWVTDGRWCNFNTVNDQDSVYYGDKVRVPKVRILKHDGSQTATTDYFVGSSTTSLSNTFLAETNNFDGTGEPVSTTFVGNEIAYIYARLTFSDKVFTNGVPLITAVVKGRKVYDPRTATTAYSNNAALVIRDYLTSAFGLNDSEIDDTYFAAAANICDEDVALDGGGTEKRYTINGVVPATTSRGEVLTQMMSACGGTLFWGGGKWKLIVGDYVAPTKTLTMDDLRSAISLDTRLNLRDQFNRVSGTFTSAADDWITTDYPAITSATFLAEDGGQDAPLDLPLPFTTSAASAQRLAKQTLFRAREQMTFSAEFGLNALDVEVGEIISLDIDRYGWSGKEFEVVGWSLRPNQQAGDLRVALTLRETSEAAFDWNAEESDLSGGTTTIGTTEGSDTTITTPEGTGAVGDGVTDDTAAFQEAFNGIGGSILTLDGSKTYVINTRPTEPDDNILTITSSNFIIEGNGATIDMSGAGDNDAASDVDTLIKITGTLSETEKSITGSVAKYQDTFTCTAHGYSVGDTVLIYSDQNIAAEHAEDGSGNPIEQLGQYFTIKAVTTDTITTEESSYHEMDATIAPVKVKSVSFVKNFTIRNINFIGVGRNATADWAGDIGIGVDFGQEFKIEGCTFNGMDYQPIAVESCRDFDVTRNVVYFDERGSTNLNAIQYGVAVKNASDNGRVVGNTFYGGKHGIDFTRNRNFGIARNVILAENHVYGTWEAGIATHGNSEFMDIYNNVVQNCLYGINTRTPNTKVHSNTVVNCTEGIRFTDNPHNVSVYDNYVKDCLYGIRLPATDMLIGRGERVGNIFLDGNTIIAEDLGPDATSTGMLGAIEISPSIITRRGEIQSVSTSGSDYLITIEEPGAAFDSPDVFVGARLYIDLDGDAVSTADPYGTVSAWNGTTNVVTVPQSAYSSAPVAGDKYLLRQDRLRGGIASQSGTSVVLDAAPGIDPNADGENPADNYLVGFTIVAAGQSRTITGWDYSTLTLTTDTAFSPTLTGSDTYTIYDTYENLFITNNKIVDRTGFASASEIEVLGNWQNVVIHNNFMSSETSVATACIFLETNSEVFPDNVSVRDNFYYNKNAPLVQDFATGEVIVFDKENFESSEGFSFTVDGNKTLEIATNSDVTLYKDDGTTAGVVFDASTGELSVTNDFSVDTDTLHVDSVNDRVGVNTATPSTALDVVGAANVSAGITTQGNLYAVDLSLTGDIQLGGDHVWFNGLGVTSGDYLEYATLTGLTYYENGVAKWRMAGAADNYITGGSLGIGTQTPSVALDVIGEINASDSITTSTDLIAEGIVKVGSGTGGAGTDTNMVTTGAASAWLNIKGGAGRAKITLGNDDTNIAAGSTGAIAFRTGAGSTDLGTEVARITSTGLGIGTIAPTEKLEVAANALHRIAITATDTTVSAGADYGGISWKTNDASNPSLTTYEIYQEAAGTTGLADLVFTNHGNQTVRFDWGGDISFYDSTGTSQGLFWDASTSRLGIGITAPSYQLDVSNSLRIFGSSPQFVFKETDIGNQHRFIASSGHFYIQVMDSDLTNDGRLYLTGHNVDDAEQVEIRSGIFNVQSSSTSRLYVNASGNVGIGTTTPSVALEVNGSSIVQSTLQVNNLIRQATKTVATLPTSGVFAGDRSFVTDATATTFASVVAGGGSNKVPVYYDGTDWRIG